MSWEEYKKKREETSSWEQYKQKRENKTQEKRISNNVGTTQNKASLWDNIKKIAGNAGRIADNLRLGGSSGSKQALNFSFITANERNKTEQQVKNERVLGSKELSNSEKATYIASQNKSNENTANLPTINLPTNKSYDKNKVEDIANYSALDKSIQKDQVKIQENIEQQTDAVSKKLAELAPSIGNMAVGAAASTVAPSLGTTYFITSAGGSYMQDALDRGMSRKEAIQYGKIMGAMEGATEAISVGTLSKAGKGLKALIKGSGKEIIKESAGEITKNSLKSVLKDYGIGIAENAIQEAIIEPIQEVVAGQIGGKDKANWNDIGQRMLQSGIDGGLTSAILGGANLGIQSCIGVVEKTQNDQTVTKQELQTAVKDASKQLDVEKMITDSTEQQINKYKTLQKQPQSTQNAQNTPNRQVMPMQEKNTQKGISEQVNKNTSKRFQEGLEKFKSGKYNQYDNIVVLEETPQYLYNKGYEYEQPIVINMDKLNTIMKVPKGNVNGKNQHGITMDIIEQLPEAISNPLNVIKNPKYNNRYVIVTELTDQYGDIVIVPIEMNTEGHIEGIRTDVNRASTVYGKEYYDLPKDNKIDSYMERNKDNIVYDIDTYNKRSSNVSYRLQLPSSNTTASITNSIPQNTKNVNGNTTSNYSMQESENNSGSFKLPQNKILNPTEISNIKPSNASTTPKLPNVNYGRGNKQSSFFANVVTDAKFLNQDLRQQLSQEDNIRYYKGITNQETLEKAYNNLNQEGEKATLNWINKDTKNIKAEDVAKGWILLKQYQDVGDYQGAVEIAKKMREMATGAGQTVQAYNILSRLTPEGMFYYAQSELSEAYNKMVEGKSQKWIEENKDKFELTPTETQFIMDTMKDVANMKDGYDKKVKLAEIQTMLKNKIPATTGQSIKAWMRISMLFNPKTQVRNILGNAVVLPVNVGGDIIAAGVDKIISKKTGVRTTGNINIKNYSKGFGKGLFESYNDFRKGVNTRNIEGNRFEVSEGKSFKDKGIGKALNRVDNILSFMLDAGDRGFYEATFTNSINNQLVLNNTTEVTQDMIDIATNEALQRTWQDNNKYTEAVLKIRNILNYANVKGYGLGDVIIPFAKTPANLTKAIVDYSPVGLAKAITLDAKTFKNSLENGQYTPQMQHKLVQNIGKGMVGSFLYILGYALAKAGIASGEADDDKDVKNFMKNSLGISSYSIKIGDKTFTYDWAQPIATPLAIMTNYVKYSDENPEASIIDKSIKSLNIGTEQLLQQSFMESLNTVLNGNGTTLENLSQAVLELPARAIPTLSKQIADMIDVTQRTSFEYDKPIQSAVNSVVAKLPVASKSLPVARDTLGNEIKKYGGENNIFNVMFNPANVNKGQLSKAGEEIYRLYQETGETTVFPITAPYYINSKGEKITMTAEERSDYQKVTGEYTEKAIEELLSNSEYKKLSNEKKAELISDIISDSNAKAKHDILNIETEETKKKRELIEKINTKNYYDYRLKTKDIEGTNATRRKNEVLLNASYTNKVKDILYTSTTGKEDNLYNILSNGNININEYLDYKIRDSKDEFSADKNREGETISGSSKKKVYNYVNNNITGVGNRLIILGNKYKLQDNERKLLSEYINKIVPNTNDRIEIFKKLSKNYVVKDRKVYYK